MKLIVGGAYQGKLDYVLSRYGVRSVANGELCTVEDTLRCEAINHFETFIKRYYTSLDAFNEYLSVLERRNPSVIVVSTEVGCGIVPIEKSDRDYRELVGRACCEVSKRASTVERVFCGLGVSIK